MKLFWIKMKEPFALLLVTLLSLAFALIPEIVMWFSWNLVQPTDELVRLLLVALFFIFGGGMCILFAFLGFLLWVFLIKVFF